MKVLLVNGSPHKNGCTHAALEEVGRAVPHKMPKEMLLEELK